MPPFPAALALGSAPGARGELDDHLRAVLREPLGHTREELGLGGGALLRIAHVDVTHRRACFEGGLG